MNEADFEHAAWLDEMARASGEAAARKANAPQTHPDFDGEHCVECGDDMPRERLAIFKVRCVLCQTRLERRSR
jgi:RNA polymerase-binding transcription factor DksA